MAGAWKNEDTGADADARMRMQAWQAHEKAREVDTPSRAPLFPVSYIFSKHPPLRLALSMFLNFN